MPADAPTLAVTTWLVFSTAAQSGLVQSTTAIQYRDAESCRIAAAHLTVRHREADAWLTREPYCTDRRPDWWWPAGGRRP